MIVSFEAAMESDLNVPMALGAVFILIRKANPQLAKEELSKDDASLILSVLHKIQSILALFDFNPAGTDPEDPEIEALVNRREEARERKEYAEADRIREELRDRQVVLEDTAYGTVYWVETKTIKG